MIWSRFMHFSLQRQRIDRGNPKEILLNKNIMVMGMFYLIEPSIKSMGYK